MEQKLITKKEIFPLFILFAAIIIGVLLYPKLPQMIPSHWNMYGEIDGYMSKKFNVIFFSSLLIFIYLLTTLLPLIDPLRKNIERSAEAYFWLRTLIIAYFTLLYMYVLHLSLQSNRKFSMSLFFLPLGLLVIGMGYIMPKIKRNYFLGIRTPWTLQKEKVWDATHQRAKKWFISAGMILIVGNIFELIAPFRLFILYFIIFIGAILWPIADSYFIYKRLKEDNNYERDNRGKELN